jgi:hypothetical protein
MDLGTSLKRSAPADQVFKLEPGHSVLQPRDAHPTDTHVLTLSRVHRNVAILQRSRLEPRLDDDEAAINDMVRKTPDRLSQSPLGYHVADGAEQTHQSIVPLPDAQLHHILADEPAGGIFATRLLDEPRLEVNAIDRESMLPQMARVLAGTARDVEDALRGRCATTDELGQVS